MFPSTCLCSKKSQVLFSKYIEYKNEKIFIDYEGIIIGKCKACGLLKTFLPKNSQKNSFSSARINYYEKSREFFIDLFIPVVKKILEHKNTGILLDVGCSTGIMLKLLKKAGFKVFGIEPEKQAFLFANKKFSGKIFNGYLREFILSNKKKFDVVIYNHVLEHIEDVDTELNLIKKIIAKNGILVVSTPNTDNIIFYLRQKYWESIMPKEHIWHFSKKNLGDLLEKNGFEIINITFSDDKRHDYSFSKKVYFHILSIINKLFNTGESMLLIAKYQA